MAENLVLATIAHHKVTGKGGLVSICSAHPAVIEASVRLFKDEKALLLLESTSNQVDQFGGYTGLTPAQFVAQTQKQVADLGFPLERLVFGGDHLGPNAWQHLPAEEALLNAEELVRQYTLAGYDKIHLDCSMSCADDPQILDDETVATRSARLMKICEETRASMKNASPIAYIIGTEVPAPGGAKEEFEGVPPTKVTDAEKTLKVHQEVFEKAGLSSAWHRVIGLVVQPGVEFNHHEVVHYDRKLAKDLSDLSKRFEYAVFEAHSTDYQKASAYRELVEDHFAILKVGPALTFAYREALYGLAEIGKVLFGHQALDIQAVVEEVLLNNPKRWASYYHGTAEEQKILRHYSLSDRVRYYWGNETLQNAVQALLAQFGEQKIPYGVAHQYLPQAAERAESLTAKQLIMAQIQSALFPYLQAVTE
ncbi:MAG: class II D-tagatose-bisphosphate aldolase, non-catalytic subunit [Cardiobacteriaceae bacterium]|nr:class II D-tagatose-bisphosphate aldolase, non-catalytic subunit [Cardiobacteriaceae bacterium]